MVDIQLAPKAPLPLGESSFGPFTVGAGFTGLGLVIDKASWIDPNVRLSCQLDVTYDGGANWTPEGGFADERGGGASASFVFRLSQVTTANARVRSTVNVVGGVCLVPIAVRGYDGTEPPALV